MADTAQLGDAVPPAAPQLSAEEERRQRLKAGRTIARRPSWAALLGLDETDTKAHTLLQRGSGCRSVAQLPRPLAAAAVCRPPPTARPPPRLPAGEAYFAKVLKQSKGKDLLAAAKAAGGGGGHVGAGASSGTQRLPVTTFDEDFLQAGAVIEGARTYVLGTVFVAAQAVQLVFLKVGAGGGWCPQEEAGGKQGSRRAGGVQLNAGGNRRHAAASFACSVAPFRMRVLSSHLLQSSLDALATPALLLFAHLLPAAAALRVLGAQGALELRPLSLRTLQGGVVAATLHSLQVGGRVGASVATHSTWLLALP